VRKNLDCSKRSEFRFLIGGMRNVGSKSMGGYSGVIF
jgi:hypothetical protein